MSYTINDKYNMLVIKLKTNLSNFNPNNMYLNVYLQGSSSPHSPTYVPSVSENTLTYKILHSQFNIGDVIEKFELRVENTTYLFDMGEGVSLMIDGKEHHVVRELPHAIQFNDTKTHSVQAIYKGNKDIGSAYSNTLYLTPQRKTAIDPTPDPSIPDSQIDGDYDIEIVAPKQMKYMESPNWTFIVTKGKKRLPNRVIISQTIDQNHTLKTNARGEAFEKGKWNESTFSRWIVGKYTIGATMYVHPDGAEGDEIIIRKFQELEIVKNTPTMNVEQLGNSLIVTLTNPIGNPMKDFKVSYTVNKVEKSKNTNEEGKIAIPFTSKGTYVYEIASATTSNFNQAKQVGTITIS